jgi:lipoprotein-releasing system permease protein
MVTDAAKRPIFMIDWRQRNATFFSALQVERNVMFLILTLIVLVAAFNIASSLIMLVKDKGRDIGILRTMGASQGSIMRVFLITGAGDRRDRRSGRFPGRAAGVPQHRVDPAVHVLADQHRAVLAGALLPVAAAGRPRCRRTTAVVVMALALSLLATLYPSWRAARLDPVEALRYE